MIVTIPACGNHAGYRLATYKISDNCSKCGQPRGKVFGTHSYDGSRRLNVDGWKNDCGHIDTYSDIRKEGEKIDFKQPTNFGEFASQQDVEADNVPGRYRNRHGHPMIRTIFDR